MAVIAPFEFEDAISFRGRTSYAQRAHHSFGAGRNKAQHLNPGKPRRNPFPEFQRVGLARSKAPRCFDRLSNRSADIRIAMTKNQRAETLTEIDILAPINRSHRAALRATKENRSAADSFERAHGTVHAARRDAKCTIKVR